MGREKIIVIIVTVAALAIAVGMLLGGVFIRPSERVVVPTVTEIDVSVGRDDHPSEAMVDNTAEPIAPEPKPRQHLARNLRSVRRTQQVKSDVVLRDPIFGVYLGEGVRRLDRRLGLQPSDFVFADIGGLGDAWFVMTRPEYLKNLVVFSYNGKVCVVIVYFSDATESNYNAIKQSLLAKYGNIDEGLGASLFGEVDFLPIIDGIKVNIHMNRDEGFMEDSSIVLTYMHQPLFLDLNNEIAHRKSSVVGGDI
ncbi:MAG TPA: hypothetical protein ENH94_02145 [Phycisphaerales bacterium]|nr:hypothetical protein [Phycisphaerales bacterium]